jgi:hypothetical protein
MSEKLVVLKNTFRTVNYYQLKSGASLSNLDKLLTIRANENRNWRKLNSNERITLTLTKLKRKTINFTQKTGT